MKYKVKSPLLLNGKFYGVGDEIELAEKEAEEILHILEAIEKKEEEEIQEEEVKKGGKKK